MVTKEDDILYGNGQSISIILNISCDELLNNKYTFCAKKELKNALMQSNAVLNVKPQNMIHLTMHA